jgi:hypothetical protein
MANNAYTREVVFLSILLIISSISPLFMESDLLELDIHQKLVKSLMSTLSPAVHQPLQ